MSPPRSFPSPSPQWKPAARYLQGVWKLARSEPGFRGRRQERRCSDSASSVREDVLETGAGGRRAIFYNAEGPRKGKPRESGGRPACAGRVRPSGSGDGRAPSGRVPARAKRPFPGRAPCGAGTGRGRPWMSAAAPAKSRAYILDTPYVRAQREPRRGAACRGQGGWTAEGIRGRRDFLARGGDEGSAPRARPPLRGRHGGRVFFGRSRVKLRRRVRKIPIRRLQVSCLLAAYPSRLRKKIVLGWNQARRTARDLRGALPHRSFRSERVAYHRGR